MAQQEKTEQERQQQLSARQDAFARATSAVVAALIRSGAAIAGGTQAALSALSQAAALAARSAAMGARKGAAAAQAASNLLRRHLSQLLNAALAANAAVSSVVSAVMNALAAVSAAVVTSTMAKFGLDNKEALAEAAKDVDDVLAERLVRVIERAAAQVENGGDFGAALVEHGKVELAGLDASRYLNAIRIIQPGLRLYGVEIDTSPHETDTANRPPVILSVENLIAAENGRHSIRVTTSDPEDGTQVRIVRVGPYDYEAGASSLERLTVRDSDGASASIDVAVWITDVNERPTAQAVATQTVNENERLSVTVSATDPEQGWIEKTITIDPQDYEATGGVIRVEGEIVDSGGLTSAYGFDVTIRDVNEAPLTPTVSTQFVGGKLIVTVTATDPDGEDLGERVFSYTMEELAADPDAFTVSFTDKGGLTSSVEVDPPSLGRQAASSNPQAPAILGYSLSSLPENQGAVLTVTAYDAIDGIIVRDYTISPQNFEVVSTVAQAIEITNSSGLTASATAEITITNVNEAPSYSGDDFRNFGTTLYFSDPDAADSKKLTLEFLSNPGGARIEAWGSIDWGSQQIIDNYNTLYKDQTGFQYYAGQPGTTAYVRVTDTGGLSKLYSIETPSDWTFGSSVRHIVTEVDELPSNLPPTITSATQVFNDITVRYRIEFDLDGGDDENEDFDVSESDPNIRVIREDFDDIEGQRDRIEGDFDFTGTLPDGYAVESQDFSGFYGTGTVRSLGADGFRVTLRVGDNESGSTSRTVTYSKEAVDVSLGLTTSENSAVKVQLAASDPDGDALTWGIVGDANGWSISQSGELTHAGLNYETLPGASIANAGETYSSLQFRGSESSHQITVEITSYRNFNGSVAPDIDPYPNGTGAQLTWSGQWGEVNVRVTDHTNGSIVQQSWLFNIDGVGENSVTLQSQQVINRAAPGADVDVVVSDGQSEGYFHLDVTVTDIVGA